LAGRWAVRKYALAAWKSGHPTVVRQRGMELRDLDEFRPHLAGLPEAAHAAELPAGGFGAWLGAQQAKVIFPLRSGVETIGVAVLGPRPGDLAYLDSDLDFGAGLV